MHTLAKTDRRCHPLEGPLTIREYARIQTFDDTYEFDVLSI
jgi:site-specific DNA-cytosine methylase